jgi:hypothetical protein
MLHPTIPAILGTERQSPCTVNLRQLDDLKNAPATQSLSDEGRFRLDTLMPICLKAIRKTDHPEIVMNRIVDLLKTIEQRTCYLALLTENPSSLDHLARLPDKRVGSVVKSGRKKRQRRLSACGPPSLEVRHVKRGELLLDSPSMVKILAQTYHGQHMILYDKDSKDVRTHQAPVLVVWLVAVWV